MGIKRILTPLDAHLDTRLGTVARLNQDAAKRLLAGTDYWTRENDFWFQLTGGLIADDKFKEAYAQRGGPNTMATIGASVRSGITPFIIRLLADDHINRLSQMGEPDDQIGLTINYWPYDFDSDMVEWLRDIMHELYGQTTVIELISVPMSEVTPQFLHENFAAAIMYEFPEWIKMHAVELGKIRINCFNFIAPKIFEADVSEMSIDAKKQILMAFRREKLIHMDFEFIDAKYFSVLNVHGGTREDKWLTDEERIKQELEEP